MGTVGLGGAALHRACSLPSCAHVLAHLPPILPGMACRMRMTLLSWALPGARDTSSGEQ